jgi:phosphoribosylanthranilate isomerase
MKKKLRLILGMLSMLVIIRVSMVELDTFMVGANPEYQSLEQVSAQTIPLVQLPSTLNLSAQQQTQINQLRQKTRAQISTILSEQQTQQLARALRRERKPIAAIASLNLPWSQKQQLTRILLDARQQALTILTPEQAQQLRSTLQTQQR